MKILLLPDSTNSLHEPQIYLVTQGVNEDKPISRNLAGKEQGVKKTNKLHQIQQEPSYPYVARL